MKMHKGRVRLAVTTGAAVLLLVVAVMGGAVWYAYHSTREADATLLSANAVSNDIPKYTTASSFADCKKAKGSKILQTSPAQCVTMAGKTFTDTQKYQVIKEWGVQAPYPGNLTLSYSITGNDAVFSAKQMDDLVAGTTTKCTGFAGTITRLTSVDRAYPDSTVGVGQVAKKDSQFVRVGAYYYHFTHAQSDCSGPMSSMLTSAKQKQLDTFLSQANDDVKSITSDLQAINK